MKGTFSHVNERHRLACASRIWILLFMLGICQIAVYVKSYIDKAYVVSSKIFPTLCRLRLSATATSASLADPDDVNISNSVALLYRELVNYTKVKSISLEDLYSQRTYSCISEFRIAQSTIQITLIFLVIYR